MDASLQERLRGALLPVLLNPEAGRGHGPDVLAAALRDRGLRADLRIVPPGQLQHVLAALLARRTRLVAVAGGDGTHSSAAAVLAGTGTVLLPVPLGTRNHFAQRHGLDSVASALRALQAGSVTRVPLGWVNDRCFLNNATCGYYPRLVRERTRLRSVLPRPPAALIAPVLAMARRPLVELSIEVAGARLQRRTAALWVGIGENSLQLPDAGRAAGSGHVLELILARPSSRLALTALAFRVWGSLRRRQQPADPQLERLLATSFTLRAAGPVDFATDGEPWRRPGPLLFRHQADALDVLGLVRPAA